MKMKKKTVAVTAAGGLLIAGGGTALAAYLLQAKVDGTVATRSMNYTWAANPVATASGSAAVCNVSGSGDKLTINVQGYPGDTCTVKGTIILTASENARIVGSKFTLPAGWTSSLDSCGLTVVQGAATPVQFTIKAGDSGSGSLATGDGLQMAPVSQVGIGAVTCTTS
ncbi:hypothetical protein [Branchiibius sp. NY16-3462-2]|uniref:hypothetical protein n=1 Tax=Branchiibius sp. NY16-3462-2 TaxID=1807500 RepID=UPI0025BAEF51|nr:hypothetical protein [Branchiibius sp. NY16-3462-2]